MTELWQLAVDRRPLWQETCPFQTLFVVVQERHLRVCVCVCVCVYVTLGVLGILPDLFYFVLSQGVQAAHPVLHQRRHWMCAGDIDLGRQIDVPALN